MNITEIEAAAEIVRNARKERYTIIKKNTAIRDENRKRIERNRKLQHKRMDSKPFEQKLLPKAEKLLVHTVPNKLAASLRRETKAHQALKQRHPVDWYERIMALPIHLQDRIACYVWWDYCFDSGSVLYEKHIQRDLEKKSFKTISRTEIIEALVQLGYTPYAASQRVSK